MRRQAIALIGSIVLAVSGTTVAAGTTTQAGPASVAADSGGDLRVAEAAGSRSAGRVSGTYGLGTGTVTFSGAASSAVSARARVSVNGKRVVLSRDLRTGRASWSAAGATLVPDDRAVLRGLHTSLRTQWIEPALQAKQNLTQHRDVVARLVMLLAEAPLGVRLEAQVVRRPVERTGEKALPAVAVGRAATAATDAALDTAACLRDALAVAPAGTDAGDVRAACQGSNEDGILYFSNCRTYSRTAVHDANSHCILYEGINAGPASSGCYGECGPSCNGLNINTYDCHDHDRCGRVHGGSLNPWDEECGDEYFEADDDFIWGWPNC